LRFIIFIHPVLLPILHWSFFTYFKFMMKKLTLRLLAIVLVVSASCSKEVYLSSEKQLTSFVIGTFGAKSTGVIDEVTKKIAFEVPSGTDVTKLTPVIAISPSATVVPANTIEQDFTKPVTYTVTAEDGTKQAYVVTITVLKSDENKLLSFKLSGLKPEVEGTINEKDKTILLVVPINTNVKELVPTLTQSKMATVSPATGIKQDFTKPVTYSVAAENGTAQPYVVTVELEKSSENQIAEFKLAAFNPAVVATIDQEHSTITATLPFGSDVKALVPTIAISKNAAITPLTGVANDFSAPVTYTVVSQNGTKHAYTVTVDVAKSKEKKILAFKFAALAPEVVGVVDEAHKTISLTVPFGTNTTELVPSIVTSENTTVTPATGVKQDFTKPVTYTVTADDESKESYLVTVNVGKNKEAKILDFKLSKLSPAVSGVIDQEAKTIKLVVPFGTDITSMVPSITISSMASALPLSSIAQDFTKDVTYRITSEDGEDVVYTVSVEVQAFVPFITSISSGDLFVGQEFTIKGSFFPGKTSVSLKGATTTPLNIVSLTTTDLAVSIPTTLAAGTYQLVVTSNNLEVLYNGSINVSVSDKITITRIVKDFLVPGIDQITIKGFGMTPNSSLVVEIGSKLVVGTVNGDGTEITALIPNEIDSRFRISPGVFKVRVKFNEGYSNDLGVTIVENTLPKPIINTISAVEITAGQPLVITGLNFLKEKNKVWLVIKQGDNSTYYRPAPTSEDETSMTIPTDVSMSGDYELHIMANGQEVVYKVNIKVKLTPARVDDVSPTILHAGDKITVTGDYFNRETVYAIIFNNEKHFVGHTDSKHVYITTSKGLDPGVYKLIIQSQKWGEEPVVIATRQITIVAP